MKKRVNDLFNLVYDFYWVDDFDKCKSLLDKIQQFLIEIKEKKTNEGFPISSFYNMFEAETTELDKIAFKISKKIASCNCFTDLELSRLKKVFYKERK